MGRITIFIREGCTESIRTMAVLKGNNLPFSVVNLTEFPCRQDDMVKLCRRYSTPQVFFNTRHVGEFNATRDLLGEWSVTCEKISESCSLTGSSTASFNDSPSHESQDKDNRSKGKFVLYASIYDRYKSEIGSHSDPADIRLAIPFKTRTGYDSDAFIRDESKEFCIELPNGDRSTILEMTVMLIDLIRHVDHTSGSITYKKCFTGKELVKVIRDVFEVQNNKAIKFADALFTMKLFAQISNDTGKNEQSDIVLQSLYRMKCFETPYVLNSFRNWNEETDSNYIRLIKYITKIMNGIQLDSTDQYGMMRRSRAIKHKNFAAFEEAVCQLQSVHLTQMNDSIKIAFGINVYNLMIQYALLKVGVSDPNCKSRANYFSELKFNVGGHTYTLYEWFHGILRGNVKGASCDGMFATNIPFGRNDPRVAFCVSNPDSRIHFTVNHGMISCPTVRCYSAQNLDEELTIAAHSFCENEKNVRLDEAKNEIYLSKIFTWYRMDFVNDAKQLPKFISKYTHGSLKQRIDSAVEGKNGGKRIKVLELAFDSSIRSNWVYGLNIFDNNNLKVSNGRVGIVKLIPIQHISHEFRTEI